MTTFKTSFIEIMVTTSFSCLHLLFGQRLFGPFLNRIIAVLRDIIHSDINHARPVIPAKAGIQENTGFRIKSGMTNRIKLMPSGISRLLIALSA
jgi:hypothetical protein